MSDTDSLLIKRSLDIAIGDISLYDYIGNILKRKLKDLAYGR